MRRLILALAALGALAGCARNDDYVQPDPGMARGPYHDGGPAALTLVTVQANDTGNGAHTALLINGSEQVIFDPAGSFRHPTIRREGDVLVGISPAFWQGYTSMHARPTHHVELQRVEVPEDVANRALALAYETGAVPSAHCAQSTSALLRQLPGFEEIPRTFFPNRLEAAFEDVTGVAATSYYEDYAPPGGLPEGAVLGVDRTTIRPDGEGDGDEAAG